MKWHASSAAAWRLLCCVRITSVSGLRLLRNSSLRATNCECASVDLLPLSLPRSLLHTWYSELSFQRSTQALHRAFDFLSLT